MWLLLAVASVETPDPWSALGPFLAAAIVLLGAITWLRRELSRTRDRLEKVEDERLALAERTLPALQESTKALERASALLADQAAQLRLASDLLDELRRDLRGRDR